MLHGVTLPQVEATPICGLPKSASVKPTARSMARAGACVSPSITTRECARGSTGFFIRRLERTSHAREPQRPGQRHDERRQQREPSRTALPRLERHVDEHAGRGRQAAAHAGERHVHAHVVLRPADRGEVVVAEIPAKISTGLGRTEQHRAEPQQRPRVAEHPEAHGRARQHDGPALVMLADDQRVVREGLGTLLGLLDGIELVATAADGEEAVALAATPRPRRRADGPADAAARRHRGDPAAAARGERPRAIALTTYADDASVLGALRAGARGYLTKDAGAEEIRAAVEAVARGEAALDPSVQHHVVAALERRARRGSRTSSPRARPRCWRSSPRASATRRSPSASW